MRLLPNNKIKEPQEKVVLQIQRWLFSKKKKIIILSLLLILAFALIFIEFEPYSLSIFSTSKQTQPPLLETKVEASSLKERRIIIPPGKTIGELLSAFFPSFQAIQKMIIASAPVYNLNRIKAGQSLIIRTREDGEFHSLSYEIDLNRSLEIKRESNGFSASLETIPYENQLCFLAGFIEGSLIETFDRLGEGDLLALALVEIFAWEIDFYIDLRPGDSFAVIFEKKFRKEEFVTYGDILAAQIINKGRKFQAFRFRHPETGQLDYFDADGKSLKKEFLRSPLKYSRITSRFSSSRLHPIRKVYRPHYGVDYAAPVGTPVQATANGIVAFAGFNGPSGQMIRLRHKNGYETLYLHLRSFSPGIKPGAEIKAGEVIGYVGASGESTGPHLDYRILYHGKYINPLAWRFQPARPLPSDYQEIYKTEIRPLAILLSNPLLLAKLMMF